LGDDYDNNRSDINVQRKLQLPTRGQNLSLTDKIDFYFAK